MKHAYTPSEIAVIRQNLDKSDKEIAELIGRSRTSVTLFRKRIGLNKHAQMMKPETRQFILTRADWRLIDLSRATGHHSTTISRFLNR